MKPTRFESKSIPRGRSIILLFLLIIYGDNVVTQAQQKQQYSSDLDFLWSLDTYIIKMTKDGQWTALIEDFSNEKVIWVKETKGAKQFRLPEGHYLDFSADSKWFGFISKEEEMIILDLESHKEERYSNITVYSFSNDGKYIAALQEGPGTVKELLIIDLKTKSIARRLKKVTAFDWHITDNILLATVEEEKQNQVIRYDVGKRDTQQIFTAKSGRIEHLGWNDTGTTAVFVSGKEREQQLNYYDESQGTLKTLSNMNILEKFKKYNLSNREPYVADDGKMVIFYLQVLKKSEEVVESNAQVWNTNDPWIEPRMESYMEREGQYFLTAWYPRSGEIKAIETEDLPTAAMSVNHNFALVYDQLQYEPLYKYYPNADLYIKNIESGDSTLVCRNQYTEGQFVTISPQGKYISYFRNNNWWVYNIASGQNINLTGGLQEPFQNTEHQRAGDVFPYGNPGWLQDDEQIVLYDQFDIWVMSPDGRTKKRITKGREENIRYRIIREDGRKDYKFLTINHNFSSLEFQAEEGIVLELFDYHQYKTGFALWSANFEIELIIMTDGKIDEVVIDEELAKLVYRSQRFDRPISINNIDMKTKKTNLIYQTNEGLMEYDLGTAEFIEYELDDGTTLRGSLIYPANYIPGQKYPMITEIYERESKDINNFEPPSSSMDNGFNLLKFTLNDYFVLYPDISYTIGDPGISALKSVSAAVDKVLASGRVDKNRLGLIGHSFGGYETSFIITQTNMFAGAVAGSPITDVVNYYHDVHWDIGREHMWRLENQQHRFGDSFYSMKEAYYRNSPLQHVENVNTPLLLWTGKRDSNVNWSQSVQMFLALRRLDKKAKLLLYDKENHVINKIINQKHLSRTIFDWMETYVKNGKCKGNEKL